MKTKLLFVVAAAALFGLIAAPLLAQEAQQLDIKRAAPTDAFLAVYSHHNAERDYQRKYYADVWQTIQDEHLCERFLKIVTSNLPADNLAVAKSKWQEVATALEPISPQALANANEFVLAEVMEAPVNQVLAGVRLTTKDAADVERGLVQACELLSRWSEGKVSVEKSQVKNASVTTLVLPKQSPYQPAIARLNDMVFVGTDVSLLRRAAEQLQDVTAKSKFDDPRLREALTHLPKPEDALVFFDGRQLFQNLHGISAFIRAQANNDAQAQRVGRLLDRIFDEIAVLDYEVTVQYTEPGQNRQIVFGKLADDFENKLLGRAFLQAKPFDNWQRWVPKDATAYSLSTGANLHALYEGIVKIVREEFPESQVGFDKFAAVQEQVGVNLDRDILQSFSGESVSVTVPVKSTDGTTHQESVTALQCTNPDKIRQLLVRAIDALNQIPAVQTQQLKLEDCPDLAGFQKLHAAIFLIIGAEPVIGFRDGWMMISSSQQAVQQLLAVRAGQAESIDSASSFAKFGLDPKAVNRVSYSDIGASVRQVADAIEKVSAFGQIGMAAVAAKPAELKQMQEVMALLPSVAKVVRKFDFYGHNLSVVRNGPQPLTYFRESVTEVRMPK